MAVQFQDGDDMDVNLTMTFAQRPGHKAPSGNLPDRYVHMETRPIGGDVGYLTLNTWFDQGYLVKTFDEALAQFKEAKGLVIDLRGARGGEGQIPPLFAARLVKQNKTHLGTMIMRQGKFTFGIRPRPETYDGRVAVLVDELSRSATEIFAAGLQELGRARVFGARTAGAVLPSVVDRLPNGDSFQYAIADYVTPKGKRLEGAGVTPDVEIVPTRDQLLAGRDPVLDAAVRWARTGE
jgi:carboxyl-terminal processing protease